MTEEQIKELANMWCSLNRFEIPKSLPRLKKHEIGGAMILIESIVDKKLLLASWNGIYRPQGSGCIGRYKNYKNHKWSAIDINKCLRCGKQGPVVL